MKNLIEAAQADKIEVLTHIDKGKITFVGETFVATKTFPRKDIWKEVATLHKTPVDESKSFKEHLEELGFEYEDFSQPQEEPQYEERPDVFTLNSAYSHFEFRSVEAWFCYFMGLLKRKPNFYAHFVDEDDNYSITIYDEDGKNILYKVGDHCPYVSKPYKEGLLEPPPPPNWHIIVAGMEDRYKRASEQDKQIARMAFRKAQTDTYTHDIIYK